MAAHTQSQDARDLDDDPIDWILANVGPRPSDSAEFLYDHMASQSGEALAVIYQPFDGRKRGHFADRGQILDFATVAGGGRVLDFGPGDGWPSLLIASMVDEVVGVDGSERRVQVCARNAERLGLKNARFVHVPAGQPLPFADNSFDGVAAASSIEQTPDPIATLAELHRVLKPGGRLRMIYESLDPYRGGREREIWLMEAGAQRTHVVIYDRKIDEGHVRHLGLALDTSRSDAENIFARSGAKVSYGALTPDVLEALCQRLTDGVMWITQHPSCRTFVSWLEGVGFRSVRPTHSGGWFAERLFDRLDDSERPADMAAVDKMLRPMIEVVVAMDAPGTSPPGEWDPAITAAK